MDEWVDECVRMKMTIPSLDERKWSFSCKGRQTISYVKRMHNCHNYLTWTLKFETKLQDHIKDEMHSRMVQCAWSSNRTEWNVRIWKAENMQMHPYFCVQVLTTLRWHNVWTELWEQWLILAAWSLQQGTRSCCQVSIGWSAGYSDPLDRVGDCTTHKVSIWGERDKGVRQQPGVNVRFGILRGAKIKRQNAD